MENRYFLMADVLGFSNIVVNSAANAPNGKITSWLELVELATKNAKIGIEPQLISDTAFVCAPDTADGLQQIVNFGKVLLEEGIGRSLLIRGAITCGPLEWGKVTHGKAVIEAHKLEQRQDWIGIACQGDLPRVEAMWGPEGLVCYPPPFKQGMIGLHPVVVWNVPTAKELQTASTSEPLVKPNDYLEWPWLRRLRNTNHFRAHLISLRGSAGADWSRFAGDIF